MSGEVSAALMAESVAESVDAHGQFSRGIEFMDGRAQELNVDIAFQRDSLFRRNRRLAVFDMDSTLIQAEVIDELAKGERHHRARDGPEALAEHGLSFAPED